MAGEQGLFRQEAIDARRGQWLGSIHLATPMSRWLWTSLGVALAAAIIAFLCFGHYTRRDRAAGQLVPLSGLLGITAVHAGTVSRVFVHAGQSVHEGDPLLEISGDEDSATLGRMRADISKQLRRRRARLNNNLELHAQHSRSERKQLQAELHLLAAQQTQLRAQLRLQKKQADEENALLQRIQPLLEKGYVSALRVQQQETAAIQARAQLKALRRQQLSVRQQISAAHKQLADLPLDLTGQNHATYDKIDQINQQLAQNEVARAVVLRAPQDGVVSTLLAHRGQYVAAGESLASIVPAGARLQAQLLVPSQAVGFVQPGNPVVLRYQAYPYQKFGQQYGHVVQVSRSALSPQEVLALTGRQAKQPVYRVRVALDRQAILAYGQPRALKLGMALSADILMDRRTLLEWVFEPLYGMRQNLATSPGDFHG